ncbi:unnamed protein product [Lupinus luteus]|uniref:Uncharacterized protein n=1 Tax=Lupinus luteus TaxID=3873 RepID=A0AAV1YA66_LUPLU
MARSEMSKYKANNAYPWDPSFAAGGQNHCLTSSFDILPGVWIRIRHSLY